VTKGPCRDRLDPSAHSGYGMPLRFGDCASRRIRRSHTPRDLGAALTLDDGNVVLALQIKPELGTISKISAEPDGRICSDRPASIEYVGDAAGRYAEIECEPICADFARFEFTLQEAAWMYCEWHALSLVVVYDLYVTGVALPEHKANTPTRANRVQKDEQMIILATERRGHRRSLR